MPDTGAHSGRARSWPNAGWNESAGGGSGASPVTIVVSGAHGLAHETAGFDACQEKLSISIALAVYHACAR